MPARYRRLRGGYEALELGRVRELPPDPDDFSLLQYGEGIEAELPARPGRRRGPAAYGTPLGGRGLLEAASQNLGRSVELTLSATAANPFAANILQLSCNDSEARVITVTLFGELVNPTAPNTIVEAYADVEWGSGGVRYSAEVDFQKGTVFQLCASALRINVRARGQGVYRAGAHVGYGSTAKGQQAQRTLQEVAFPPIMGATVDVVIPTFANELRIQRTPANSDFLIRFLSSGGEIRSELDVPAGTPEAGPFRIPGNAHTCRIINGGVAMTALSRIFGLSL